MTKGVKFLSYIHKQMMMTHKRVMIRSQLSEPDFKKKTETNMNIRTDENTKIKKFDNNIYEELIKKITQPHFFMKCNNFHPILIRTLLYSLSSRLTKEAKCYVIVEKDEDIAVIMQSAQRLNNLPISRIDDEQERNLTNISVLNYKKNKQPLQFNKDSLFMLYKITKLDQFIEWLQQFKLPYNEIKHLYALNDTETANKLTKTKEINFSSLNKEDNQDLLIRSSTYYLIDMETINTVLVSYVTSLVEGILRKNEGKYILIICTDEEQVEKIKYRRNKKNIKYITVVQRNYLSGIIKTNYDFLIEIPFESINDMKTRRKYLNARSTDENIGHYIFYDRKNLKDLETLGLIAKEKNEETSGKDFSVSPKAESNSFNLDDMKMLEKVYPLLTNEGKYEDVYDNIKNNHDLIEKIVCLFLKQNEHLLEVKSQTDTPNTTLDHKEVTLTSPLTKEDKNYLLKFALDNKLISYEEIDKYINSGNKLVLNLPDDTYEHIKTVAKEKDISLL